jgi:hypothetical protein
MPGSELLKKSYLCLCVYVCVHGFVFVHTHFYAGTYVCGCTRV